jgi:hypothetical protein
MEVTNRDSPFLSIATRRVPEAASQTFNEGSPVKLVAGLATAYVDIADAPMYAIAVQAASGTTGTELECVLAYPNLVEIEANVLGTSAADEVLTAGSLGTAYDLVVDANLVGTGESGWYIDQNDTTDPEVRVSAFESNQVVPNEYNIPPQAGDTNARVRCVILPVATVFGIST